jgi:Uma2 family endonuclease
MAMPIPDRSWTASRIDALPDDGKRYEVIDGVLYVTPCPSMVHQRAAFLLCQLLFPYSESVGLLAVGGPIGVRFTDRREVQPDLSVVPRLHGKMPAQFSDVGRLTLAVEVLSPSTRRVDRVIKLALFKSENVDEYWMVDTRRRTVERWRRGQDAVETLSATLRWQPVDSVEPLVIDLANYFSRVHDE